ncbi:MAG: hypothetical protein ACK57Y_10600 [Pirellulaceae bacterium]|jgi:hypothetical protein
MNHYGDRTLKQLLVPLRKAALDAGFESSDQIAVQAKAAGITAVLPRDIEGLKAEDWQKGQVIAIVLVEGNGPRSILRVHAKGTGIKDLSVTLQDVEGNLAATGKAEARVLQIVIGGVVVVTITENVLIVSITLTILAGLIATILVALYDNMPQWAKDMIAPGKKPGDEEKEDQTDENQDPTPSPGL